MTDSANISRFLPAMAVAQPDTPALKVPRGRTADGRIDYLTLSFRELDTEVDAWVARFRSAGVRDGDRVLVMVRQGLPLISAAFALFKQGAVPVVIDPGMGLRSFLACVARSRPRVLLGIPLARILSHVFRDSFRSVETRIAASGCAWARLGTPVPARDPIAPAPKAASDLAAILFTSGSTGAPKGVCYEHGMFEAQVRLIRETYAIQPGEIDLPMLPVFALFNPALGLTTVVPEIDPGRPAAVDPARIVQAIRQENVTNSFGSPTLWNKIVTHCSEKGETLPSLRRVLCAGAPVPASLWRNAGRVLTGGMLHSPYGATESLPVSSVSAAEIDPDTMAGACVGRPVTGMQVKVIAVEEGPVETLHQAREMPAGEIGELIVAGPVVTRTYDALPEATRAAKIAGNGGEVWHRLGDCGYRDEQGRLWFCGRKVERVEGPDGILHTEPCEQVFRGHPAVERCALIGLGRRGAQVPALVIQRRRNEGLHLTDRALAEELRARARAFAHTRALTRFFVHPGFPVDVRHNAKIHRLTLGRWAARAKVIEVV